MTSLAKVTPNPRLRITLRYYNNNNIIIAIEETCMYKVLTFALISSGRNDSFLCPENETIKTGKKLCRDGININAAFTCVQDGRIRDKRYYYYYMSINCVRIVFCCERVPSPPHTHTHTLRPSDVNRLTHLAG